MNVKVYQINPDLDFRGVGFMSYPSAIAKAGKIDAGIYRTVLDAPLETDDLEEMFQMFNTNPPPSYEGHSLSVSDVVETDKGCFYCDTIGFRELEDFEPEKAEPKKGHRMVVIEPHKPAYEAVIGDSLEALQAAVGGYIEITYPFPDGTFVVGNDEAKLIGLEGNRRIGGSVYAGNLLIGADDGMGGTKDLTDRQVEKYLNMFRQPEEISPEEVEADTGWTFVGFN